jgi:hypothetical protein
MFNTRNIISQSLAEPLYHNFYESKMIFKNKEVDMNIGTVAVEDIEEEIDILHYFTGCHEIQEDIINIANDAIPIANNNNNNINNIAGYIDIKKKAKVIDIILFNNEISMLQLRLNYLKHHVDMHIIIESNRLR